MKKLKEICSKVREQLRKAGGTVLDVLCIL